jgi:hypothetical protein
MTNSAVTGGIVIANALAVVSIATATELNPILECIQNGASVGAIMGIFLWREQVPRPTLRRNHGAVFPLHTRSQRLRTQPPARRLFLCPLTSEQKMLLH